MTELLTAEELRARIRAFDPTEKKVLGGLIVLMIRNHDRIKDTEWMFESLARLSVPALGLDQEGEVDEDLDTVQEFVQRSSRRVLNVAFPLFVAVANDMRQKMADGESYALDDACARALDYFE
ncbi:MAG: hypothetical protein VX951_08325 [Planctomycetota bacterium]|nr:hypothetical protein [Planctomycetota bacterium]